MKTALTPLDFLARPAFVYGDKIGAVDGDRRFTYGEFNRRIHQLASALIRVGVEPGDRVAVLAPNTLTALEPHFAVPLAGAVLVMLNTRLQTAELAWILNHCGAKVLIADPQLLPCVQPVLGDLKQLTFVTDDYEALLEKGEYPFSAAPAREEDRMICINYTSGATGVPKGVMFTHRGAYMNAVGEMLEHGLNSRSVYLWTVPLFHCNGWCFSWAVTAAAARNISLRQADPKLILKPISKHRVTHPRAAPLVASHLA